MLCTRVRVRAGSCVNQQALVDVAGEVAEVFGELESGRLERDVGLAAAHAHFVQLVALVPRELHGDIESALSVQVPLAATDRHVFGRQLPWDDFRTPFGHVAYRASE